jgi:hypothetical protein
MSVGALLAPGKQDLLDTSLPTASVGRPPVLPCNFAFLLLPFQTR